MIMPDDRYVWTPTDGVVRSAGFAVRASARFGNEPFRTPGPVKPKKTNMKYRSALAFVLIFAVLQPEARAEVEKTVNSLINRNYIPPSATVPIVSRTNNTITVYGDWLDITNGIRMTINGNTTEIRNFTSGRNPSRISFTVSTTATGTGRIVMSRLGGEDEIKISVFNDVVITEAKVLSATTNNIAYLNAFKVNTDFLVRVRGTHVNSLQFNANRSLSSVGVKGTPTSQEIIFICRRSQTTDNAELKEDAFTINIPGSSRLGYDELGTHRRNNEPFDIFRIFDKANFRISDVGNKFKRPDNQSGCPGLVVGNAGVNSINLLNPEQAIKQFNLVNPTSASPQTHKTVDWPDIRISLHNDSYAQVPAFTAVVKLGSTVLGTINIPSMIAKSTTTVSFRRPTERRKILARSLTCPDVYEVLLSPYDWVDPAYTLVLDPQNAVDEIGIVRQLAF